MPGKKKNSKKKKSITEWAHKFTVCDSLIPPPLIVCMVSFAVGFFGDA